MINEKWTGKIKGWLEQGNARSGNMEDLPWDVKLESDETHDYLFFQHPIVLYSYAVKVDKQYATITLDTGISTDLFDTDKRMGYYRRMLILNRKYNMLKVSLRGDEDVVTIESDLDLSSLGEKEFNHALHNILFASYDIVKNFNMSESALKELEARIPRAIEDMMAKGADTDTIKDFLMNKVGMEDAEAKKWMAMAETVKAEKHKKASHSDPTQHMFG
jgi:hypothetical protein